MLWPPVISRKEAVEWRNREGKFRNVDPITLRFLSQLSKAKKLRKTSSTKATKRRGNGDRKTSEKSTQTETEIYSGYQAEQQTPSKSTTLKGNEPSTTYVSKWQREEKLEKPISDLSMLLPPKRDIKKTKKNRKSKILYKYKPIEEEKFEIIVTSVSETEDDYKKRPDNYLSKPRRKENYFQKTAEPVCKISKVEKVGSIEGKVSQIKKIRKHNLEKRFGYNVDAAVRRREMKQLSFTHNVSEADLIKIKMENALKAVELRNRRKQEKMLKILLMNRKKRKAARTQPPLQPLLFRGIEEEKRSQYRPQVPQPTNDEKLLDLPTYSFLPIQGKDGQSPLSESTSSRKFLEENNTKSNSNNACQGNVFHFVQLRDINNARARETMRPLKWLFLNDTQDSMAIAAVRCSFYIWEFVDDSSGKVVSSIKKIRMEVSFFVFINFILEKTFML